MSLAMPGSDRSTCLSTGARRTSFVSGASDGWTRTRPRTALPCASASRRARHPPMEMPNTKVCSHWLASQQNAASTSAYQSSPRVWARSCQVVPWPGNRGRLTVRPSAARYSAQPRSVCGLPVKPWHSSKPTGPPAWSKGSAPGSTGDIVSTSFTRNSYSLAVARVRCGNGFQDASRGQVLLVDPHAERRECVLDCVHHRGRCDDHATFAHAPEVDVSVE